MQHAGTSRVYTAILNTGLLNPLPDIAMSLRGHTNIVREMGGVSCIHVHVWAAGRYKI